MAELPIVSFIASVQNVIANTAVRSAGQNPTAGLAALPPGTFLNGTVVSRDPKGNPVLRTDKGDLTLKSDIFLKTGAAVVIRLEAQGDLFKARIVSIDGQSPSTAQQENLRQEDVVAVNTTLLKNQTIPAEEQAAAKLIPLPATPEGLLTQSLKALLTTVQPLPESQLAALPAEVAQTLKSLIVGAKVTVRILSLELPAPAPQPGPPGQTQAAAPELPSVLKPVLNVPLNPLYANYGKPPVAATPETLLPSTLLPSAPPPLPQTFATAQPLAPTTLPAGTLEGIVIAGDGKEPLLQTPIGVIRLPAGTPLPVGTKVVFQITASQPPITAFAPTSIITKPEDTEPDLGHPWQALSQAVAALQQSAPDLAANLQRQIPTLGNQLTTGTLFFLAALKGGDVRQWLGEKTVQRLQEIGQGELLQRIAGEFGAARSALLEQPSPTPTGPTTPWQMVLIPLMHQEEIIPARMFVKKDGGGKQERGKPEGGGGTRFVVELELSELGPLQMDGFVRKQEQRNSFDLMIRSLRGLHPDMQSDIAAIFTEAAQLTGFTGSVQFQTTKHFPVNPLEEVMAARQRTIIA